MVAHDSGIGRALSQRIRRSGKDFSPDSSGIDRRSYGRPAEFEVWLFRKLTACPTIKTTVPLLRGLAGLLHQENAGAKAM